LKYIKRKWSSSSGSIRKEKSTTGQEQK